MEKIHRMKIAIKADGQVLYVLSHKDDDDYLMAQANILSKFYDPETGEPINNKVQEMDDCIEKRWNPEKFIRLYNELHDNYESNSYAESI